MNFILASIIYVLMAQWDDHRYRYCEYFNGEVLVVTKTSLCPTAIRR